MTDITYILMGFMIFFAVATVWYRKQYKKKEDESDYFTYHYIQLRKNNPDTGLSDAIKYNHANYKKRILDWGKPNYPKDKQKEQ